MARVAGVVVVSKNSVVADASEPPFRANYYKVSISGHLSDAVSSFAGSAPETANPVLSMGQRSQIPEEAAAADADLPKRSPRAPRARE